MKILSLATLLCIGTCIAAKAEQESSSQIFTPSISNDSVREDHSLLVNKFYEVMQNNDIQKLSSILSSDYHVSNAGDLQESSYSKFTEMSKNLPVRITALHKALPDFKLTLAELLIDGNQVLARGTLSGIQKGTFLGIAPTNKPIHIKFFNLITIKENKIVNITEMWNELSVMKQLGYIVF